MSKKKNKSALLPRDISIFFLRGRKAGPHGDARKEASRRACRQKARPDFFAHFLEIKLNILFFS